MVKKYIIMAGGNYEHWKTPRHLSVINGEMLIQRTIRLLRENGIEDISISTDNPIFEQFGLPILKHDNSYNTKWHKMEGDWCDAFYPTDEPVCYVLGDVYFSEEAINKIVNSETDDIQLFGSIPPFADNYIKNHIEAFALKVVNVEHFKQALIKTKQLDKRGKFWRKPIIWELWTVIKDVPLQTKADDFIYNYEKINDYTCDIDWNEDILKLQKILGGIKMIKVEVVEDFTLSRFNEIKNIERKGPNMFGKLFKGDIFECESDLGDYLMGQNKYNKSFVKLLEIQNVVDTASVGTIDDLDKVDVAEQAIKPSTKKSKKSYRKKSSK